MITKTCECGIVFEYEPPKNYPDRRKYCNACKFKKEEEYQARQNPVPAGQAQPVPTEYEQKVGEPLYKEHLKNSVKAENGEYQSTVYNRTVAANSYEVGTAGNRFKLYFETPAELKAKMQELRDA
ncbi:hypothetical protein LCGC14_2613950, partial [marine sediment metagenome]